MSPLSSRHAPRESTRRFSHGNQLPLRTEQQLTAPRLGAVTNEPILPDLGLEHRRRLVASIERPDIASRPGTAMLWIVAVLLVTSCVVAAAQLADDIRAARAAAERCGR